MLYFMWLLSFFSALAYAFSQNKKMIKKISLVMIFLFMLIMVGWSRGSYDVEIGIYRYNNFSAFESFTEVGYSFFVTLGHKIGLSYRAFFVLWSLFELAVLFWFVNKNAEKSPIVFGIFMVWPMISYFQYTRSIAAFSFIIIAIDILLKKRKFYIIKYSVLVLIAASIHFSSLFFFLYLLGEILNKKKTALVSVGMFILLYMSAGIDFLSELIIKFVGETRNDIVMNSINADGVFGRIFGIILYIIEFFAIYYCMKILYKIDFDDRKSDLVFKFNTISFILVPLTLRFGLGFARFPMLLGIINYTFFVDKISTIKSQRKRIMLYSILAVFVFGLLIINARNIAYRQLVINPFFEQNELIK